MTLSEGHTGGGTKLRALALQGRLHGVSHDAASLMPMCFFGGGVIIFVKKWVLIGFLMDEIGVMDTQSDPSDPNRPKADPNGSKLFGLIRALKTRWLVGLLAC